MAEQELKANPVIQLILDRLRSESQPLQRKDGYKLGLAIEGGAMRGVVSAGMVTALEYLGLLRVFEAVYGSSAGAFNGAFFLAGQAAFGTTIYSLRFKTKYSLFAALHASSKMPLVAGSPVRINGDRFLDVSVFEAVPVNAALQDNCTHVLVLLTRPEGQLKQPHLFDREIIAPRLDRLRTGLGSSYLNSK